MPNIQFINKTTKVADDVMKVQSHEKKYDDKITMLFNINLDAINQFKVQPQRYYAISNQIFVGFTKICQLWKTFFFNYEITTHPEAPNFIS